MLSSNVTRIIPSDVDAFPGDVDDVPDLLHARFLHLGPNIGGFSLFRKATSNDDHYGHENLGSAVPIAISVAVAHCSTNEV